MTDVEFTDLFISGGLPPADFDHQAHLRAACLLLSAHPFLEACILMRDGLRCMARKAGKPTLYHETVTVAFMAIVSERMQACEGNWQTLVLSDRALFDRKLLLAYYSPERLASDKARQTFTMPDRPGVVA